MRTGLCCVRAASRTAAAGAKADVASDLDKALRDDDADAIMAIGGTGSGRSDRSEPLDEIANPCRTFGAENEGDLARFAFGQAEAAENRRGRIGPGTGPAAERRTTQPGRRFDAAASAEKLGAIAGERAIPLAALQKRDAIAEVDMEAVLCEQRSRLRLDLGDDVAGRCVAMLAEHNVGALIVSADGESLDGIVSERDVVRHLHHDGTVVNNNVRSIMTEVVETCASTDELDSLMETMTSRRIRHVPVVDDGKLVGIISIGDAVKHKLSQLQFERDQLDSYVHRS